MCVTKEVGMSGVACEWFARCDREADGWLAAYGGVMTPCCERCAKVVGAEDELEREET